MAGGSNSTISVGAAVKAACDEAKKTIHGLAGEDERFAARSELGTMKSNSATAAFIAKTMRRKERRSPRFSNDSGMDKIEAEGKASPGEESQKYSMGSYGAQFCEVRVDEDTGEVRVSRFLGVFDCGRIINPKTASSQWRGGITMGLGMALTEEALFDVREGSHH